MQSKFSDSPRKIIYTETEENIRTAGRGFGIFHEMWRQYNSMIIKGVGGMAADPSALPELYMLLFYNYTVADTPENREKAYVTAFRSLLAFSPTVKTELSRTDSDRRRIASLLEAARGDTRRSHATTVKKPVGGWHIFSPGHTEKGPWGWFHDECGRLLCPPNIEWDDV